MANNTTGLPSDSIEDYKLFNTVFLFLKIGIIFIIIVGNVLTICAIYRFKTLRYPSNVMIACLAVSDLLMGSVYTPLILIRTNLPFLFVDRLPCLALLIIGQTFPLGNVVFQSFLSIERFYAVQFPYRYHSKVTIKHNLIWSLVAFVGLLSVGIPMLCGIDRWSENVSCYSPLIFPKAYSRFFIGTFLGFQMLGILAFLRVLVAELSFRRRDRNLQTSEVQKQDSVQSTIMIFAYVVSMCFYMPHVFYFIWWTFTGKRVNPVVMAFFHLLDLCNSAINCFVYGFKNSKFREAYKKLLRCKSSRVDPQSNNTIS